MIIVHEGLPRSGKSYEAVVRRIIPAIQQGRRVFTNIDGISIDKISEVCGYPPDRVSALLFVLTPEQLATLWEVDLKNSLLVLDEVQNIWGVKAKLPGEMVKFIAEHGHHGIDVILMSQDIKDINVIWRRRIEIRQVTLKLSAIGASKSYSVTTYRGKGNELYEKVGTKVIKYDPKYFGTYKSYSDSDVSTSVLADDRASVWGNAIFTQVIPVVLIAAGVGGWFLWDYFTGDTLITTPPASAPSPASPAAVSPSGVASSASPTRPLPALTQQVKKQVELAQQMQNPALPMLKQLSDKHRLRLAAVLIGQRGTDGVIEWVQEGGRVSHRLTIRQLRDMGVTVDVIGDAGARLVSGGEFWFATAFPTDDPLGKISTAQTVQLRNAGGVPAAPTVQPSPAPSPAVFGPSGGASEVLSGAVEGGRPSTDAHADQLMLAAVTKRQPLPHYRY